MIYRRLISLAAVCALLVVPGYASAQELLWDSPPNNDLPAFVDQQFPDFPDFSTYELGCVLVPDNDSEFLLTDVSTYFTNFNLGWPLGDIEATLNVVEQPDGGGLPPNDYNPEQPELGGQGITVIGELIGIGDRLELRANVSDEFIVLTPGTKYWIGLTPRLDFGLFGQEFHKGSDFFIKNTAARNPGGGFDVGTDWFEAGPIFGGVDWGMAITVFGKKLDNPISCTVDLIADGGSDETAVVVGTVTAELNDDGTWTVTYETTGSWMLQETHLHAGCELADFPLTRNGNPKVGQFNYKADHDPLVQTFTYIVDAQDCDCVLFGAHAEVVDTEDCDDDGVCREETAWGEGERFRDGFPQNNNGRGNWAMYFKCGDCDP